MRLPPVALAPRAGSYRPFLEAPVYREVQAHLATELRRARRYENPLGVVVLGIESYWRRNDGAPDGAPRPTLRDGRADATPAIYGLLGSFLRNTMRETDILAAAPEALAFVTFLPGTDRDGADRAFLRYRQGFAECAAVVAHGGVAAFPDDGLTIEDLVDRASDAWRHAGRSAELPAELPAAGPTALPAAVARAARGYARG